MRKILNEGENKFKKLYLNLGCGDSPREMVHPIFLDDTQWVEVRVDSDPEVKPDVLSDVVTLDGVLEYCEHPIHGIYSSHCIEHLHPYSARQAIKRWKQVLSTDGVLVIRCPNFQMACKEVAEGRGYQPLYSTPSGPITPLDMIFGFHAITVSGKGGMNHMWGYTRDMLEMMLCTAGYSSVNVCLYEMDLVAFARK